MRDGIIGRPDLFTVDKRAMLIIKHSILHILSEIPILEENLVSLEFLKENSVFFYQNLKSSFAPSCKFMKELNSLSLKSKLKATNSTSDPLDESKSEFKINRKQKSSNNSNGSKVTDYSTIVVSKPTPRSTWNSMSSNMPLMKKADTTKTMTSSSSSNSMTSSSSSSSSYFPKVDHYVMRLGDASRESEDLNGNSDYGIKTQVERGKVMKVAKSSTARVPSAAESKEKKLHQSEFANSKLSGDTIYEDGNERQSDIPRKFMGAKHFSTDPLGDLIGGGESSSAQTSQLKDVAHIGQKEGKSSDNLLSNNLKDFSERKRVRWADMESRPGKFGN